MGVLYGILYSFLGYQGVLAWFAARHQFTIAKEKIMQIGAMIIAGVSIYLAIWSGWHLYVLIKFGTFGLF